VLPHSVVVAAWDFSEGARKQIAAAKGKCITIDELIKQKPDGKNVRIIG
jgi:large subunit ribosomal protein L18e